MCEVLVLLTGEISIHSQGLRIAVYDLVSMKHGKVGFLLIVNGDRHLVRDIEDRFVPGHCEEAF